jgi:hypothetical protein
VLRRWRGVVLLALYGGYLLLTLSQNTPPTPGHTHGKLKRMEWLECEK